MGRTFILMANLTVLLLTPIAFAQTAFRCDVNGTTAYSDKPCPPGNTGKAVTSTQETPEQIAASKAANEQMRKDSADLNKRLVERQKLEAKERADARKAAVTAREAAKEKAAKASKGSKASKNKATTKSTRKKTKSGSGSAPNKS